MSSSTFTISPPRIRRLDPPKKTINPFFRAFRCLLALAIALVQAGEPVVAVYVFLCMIAFGLFCFVAVRPFLAAAIRHVNQRKR
jgi:hypothetical protein